MRLVIICNCCGWLVSQFDYKWSFAYIKFSHSCPNEYNGHVIVATCAKTAITTFSNNNSNRKSTAAHHGSVSTRICWTKLAGIATLCTLLDCQRTNENVTEKNGVYV